MVNLNKIMVDAEPLRNFWRNVQMAEHVVLRPRMIASGYWKYWNKLRTNLIPVTTVGGETIG